jgi:predicted regulator of Ras-like GTPase activity (Roadblock/LC7/MglB family)
VETEIERLRKKVENFPSASSYTRLAELARAAGDEAEAERACRKCIKEFPRNGQAYVILAEISLAAKRKEEAVQHLQAGIEKDQRNYSAHKLMADLLVADGNVPQAVVHLRQILTFKPGDAAVTQRIAELDKGAAAPKASPLPGAVPAQPRPAATGAGSAVRPAVPSSAPAASTTPAAKPAQAAAPRPIAPAKGQILDAICAEPGVRGALVADPAGRTVQAKNLKPDQEELLAALAAELGRAGGAALTAIGQGATTSVILAAANGQVLRFSRGAGLSVVVLAEPAVRPAMLELRARQALVDLGAA